MSANSFPPPHRLGVLMSPAGRFLECSHCHLSFNFPYGERFVTVAKQFDAQLCVPVGRVEERVTDGTERRFVIVRYEGEVPMMASCTKCLSKFFTPTTHAHDAIEAEGYLVHKFHLHRCHE